HRLAGPARGHGHVMGFVADVNARRIGMHDLQAKVFRLDSPRYFPSLLPIHLVPAALVGASCSLLLLLGGPHGILAALNSTWLGPCDGTYTISPSGSGISFFKDH